jgi:hypothetical protein
MRRTARRERSPSAGPAPPRLSQPPCSVSTVSGSWALALPAFGLMPNVATAAPPINSPARSSARLAAWERTITCPYARGPGSHHLSACAPNVTLIIPRTGAGKQEVTEMEPASPVLHPPPQGILAPAEQMGSQDEILDLTVIPPLVRAGEGAMVIRVAFQGPRSWRAARGVRTATPPDHASTTWSTRFAEFISALDWLLHARLGRSPRPCQPMSSTHPTLK